MPVTWRSLWIAAARVSEISTPRNGPPTDFSLKGSHSNLEQGGFQREPLATYDVVLRETL